MMIFCDLRLDLLTHLTSHVTHYDSFKHLFEEDNSSIYGPLPESFPNYATWGYNVSGASPREVTDAERC